MVYLGFLPLQELLDRGVTVCLGPDAAAAANSLDMFNQMRTAALIHKGHHEDMTRVPAERVFEMATFGGARALRMGNEIGRIARGYKADVVIIDRRRAGWVPMHDVVSNLVYSGEGTDVKTVIVDGRIIVRDRRVLTLDEGAVLEAAERRSAETVRKLGIVQPQRYPMR